MIHRTHDRWDPPPVLQDYWEFRDQHQGKDIPYSHVSMRCLIVCFSDSGCRTLNIKQVNLDILDTYSPI